jgi:putative IMPACT (imprinted ancient) family translation regulator
LINAYKSATIDAINNAKIINKTVNSVFIINFNHSQMNDVMKIIKEEDLKIKNQNFDIYCSFVLEIRHSQVNKVLGKLEKLEGLNWISRKV